MKKSGKIKQWRTKTLKWKNNEKIPTTPKNAYTYLLYCFTCMRVVSNTCRRVCVCVLLFFSMAIFFIIACAPHRAHIIHAVVLNRYQMAFNKHLWAFARSEVHKYSQSLFRTPMSGTLYTVTALLFLYCCFANLYWWQWCWVRVTLYLYACARVALLI